MSEQPFADAVRRYRAGESAAGLARELVDAMTIEERLQVLDGDTELWSGLTDMAAGGYHRHPWPASAVPRLGVPGFRFADGPRGVVVGRATCFPVPMARAATWDPALEERVGEAIGVEMRRAGADLFGGVCVNLLRHPRWGRAQETYGEDPLLVGEMGAALTRGAQRHVMACVKHFALNSMENARFQVDVAVDDRALHEVYLPHFRRVVDEGVAVVMSAYNSVDGSWSGESSLLLTEILRDDWGFDGFVVSDFVFGLRDPVRSVQAGLDVELPFRQQRAAALPGALEDGRLDRSAVSAAAWSVVATLLRFADRLVPADAPVPDGPVARPEHLALAREVAQRSIVLLRNEPVDGRPVLPLAAAVGRIAVVGPLADMVNLGDRGSSDVLPVGDAVTPLQGLRAVHPDVVHDSGDDPATAAALAADSDVAVVVVGCTYRDEGEFIDASTTQELGGLFPEGPLDPPLRVGDPRVIDVEGSAGFGGGGDRRSLQLSARDRRLVEAVAAANARTVVVLMGGSAIVVDPWHEDVAAIVQLWYPGVAGGDALADVLRGAVEPTGRLPFAVPVDEADLVPFDPDASAVTYDLWHGQWRLDRDGVAARYPFGFGLSYTECVVERAELEVTAPAAGGCRLRVRATVRNLGDRLGDEVVQVYAGMPRGSSVERPPRRLVAFGRVRATPGQVGDIELDVPEERLRVRVDGEWSVEEGTYELVVGLSAADPQSIVLEAEISCRPA